MTMTDEEVERLAMSDLLWALYDGDDRLMPFDTALEEALEKGVTMLDEYRPAELSDIDVADLADRAWECIRETLWEDEKLTWEDDGAEVAPLGTVALGRLTHVLTSLLTHQVDLSRAAWQPTGRTRLIAPDGTWTEVSP